MSGSAAADRERVLGVALGYVDALGGDDPDAVADRVAESFENIHQSALGEPTRGRDHYRSRLPAFFAAFPRRRYVVVESAVDTGSRPDGGEVVVRYRLRASAIVGDDGRSAEIDLPGVMWISVRGDLVERRIDTWDAALYARQAGVTLPPE